MTKKRRVIISTILAILLVIGTIIALLIAYSKKFDISASEPDFNQHTQMTHVSRGALLSSADNTLYANGTEIVKNIGDKRGIYSYFLGGLIVPCEYDNIVVTYSDARSAIFQLFKDSSGFRYVNEKGMDLKIVTIENNLAKVKVKSNIVNLVNKKGTLQANYSQSEHYVECQSISLVRVQNHDNSQTTYQLWQITDNLNMKYLNLYKVNGSDEPQLISTIDQTIGLKVGDIANFDGNENRLAFYENGEPYIIQTNLVHYQQDIVKKQIRIYNIHNNFVGQFEMHNYANLIESKSWTIGDNMYFQFITTATIEKYNLLYTIGALDNGTPCDLVTYRFNLRNGKVSNVAFDYVVQDATQVESMGIIKAIKVTDKKMSETAILLCDETLKAKELDYSYDSLLKLNASRYLAFASDTSVNLIDKKYNLIARLDGYIYRGITKNAIVVTDTLGEYAYILDYNGAVVSRVLNSQITMYNHDTYYIKTTSDGTTTNYHLEELGKSKPAPIFATTASSSSYTIDGITYVRNTTVKLTHNGQNVLSMIMRVRAVASTYTYYFYSLDGKVVATLSGKANSGLNAPIIKAVYDSHLIVVFDGGYYLVDR